MEQHRTNGKIKQIEKRGQIEQIGQMHQRAQIEQIGRMGQIGQIRTNRNK